MVSVEEGPRPSDWEKSVVPVIDSGRLAVVDLILWSSNYCRCALVCDSTHIARILRFGTSFRTGGEMVGSEGVRNVNSDVLRRWDLDEETAIVVVIESVV
jgi:hypothetical protein